MKKKREIEKEQAFNKRETSININKSMHAAMSDAFKEAKDEAKEKSDTLKQKAHELKQDAKLESDKAKTAAKDLKKDESKGPLAAVAKSAEKVITEKGAPITAKITPKESAEAELMESDYSDDEPMFDEDLEFDDGDQSQCDEQNPQACKKMALDEMSDIDLDQEPDFDEDDDEDFGNNEIECRNDPEKCKEG